MTTITINAGFNQRILGDASRPRLPTEDGLLYNRRNYIFPGNTHEVGYSCGVWEIPEAASKAYHVVSIAPYTSSRLNHTFAHHMDIFWCDDRMQGPVPDSECHNVGGRLHEGGPCYMLPWAYDKGALNPFELPWDAGFRVGAGTPFTRFILQIHYLLPPGVAADELAEEGYRDVSGVQLQLTSQLRPMNAGSIAWMDVRLHIPPLTPHHVVTSSLSPPMIDELLHEQMASAGGTLQLRAAHLHAHHHATSVKLYRIRNGVRQILAVDDAYCGEGECQRFRTLPAGSDVRQNDSLHQECTFRNTGKYPIDLGVGREEEMCGPIVIFTPFDHSDVRNNMIPIRND